jgi:cytochrome c553
MRMNRKGLALASWIAMLAMLMAIVLPALAHAFAADSTARYLAGDICRAGSAAAAQVDTNGGAAPPAHDSKLKHCSYCHHGNGVPLLAQAPRQPALAVADTPPSARQPGAPRYRSAWTAAQARAPPSA